MTRTLSSAIATCPFQKTRSFRSSGVFVGRPCPMPISCWSLSPGQAMPQARSAAWMRSDRKSVVEGKSVSVRVDLGGGRIIKKKKITRGGQRGAVGEILDARKDEWGEQRCDVLRLIICMWELFHIEHFFFFKQKTAYEILGSDWSSDVSLPI